MSVSVCICSVIKSLGRNTCLSDSVCECVCVRTMTFKPLRRDTSLQSVPTKFEYQNYWIKIKWDKMSEFA